MDDIWSSLPRGAVLVCAAILCAGASTSAAASSREHHEDEVLVDKPDNTQLDGVQPDSVQDGVQPDESDSVPKAPTCGPCCHGDGPKCGPDRGVTPPPIPPKQGCAVVEPEEGGLGGWALLGLAGLAGLGQGRRRRNENHEP